MSVVAYPPTKSSSSTVFEPLPAPALADAPVEVVPFSDREMYRWVAVLVAPFVVGAAFLGLAIGLDAEWPIAPAFLLGPLVLISGYIYLSLTSEANTTS
jgi:hypothetical protein